MTIAFVVTVVAKATLMLLLALGGTWMLRRRSASIRHLLLVAAFLAIGVLPFAAAWTPAIPIRTPAPVASAGQAWSETSDAFFSPAGRPMDGAVASLDESNQAMSRGWYQRLPLSRILMMVWLSGVALLMLPVVIGAREAHRLRRRAMPWPQGSRLVQSVCDEIGVRRRVEVLLDQSGPAAIGLVRSAVLLPLDVRVWNRADVRRALIHELEHVRRRDCLLHLIARIVCAVYWCHPLVWVTWRRLGLDAERACDDAVVRVGDPTGYADQLVALAERSVARARRPLLAMASRSDLAARLVSVLAENRPRDRANGRLVTAVAAGAAVLVTVVAPLRAMPADPPQAPAAVPRAGAVTFEVVSIKRNTSGAGGSYMGVQPGGRVVVTNLPVREVLIRAYGIHSFQFTGGPDWLSSERYDIQAKAPAGAAATDDVVSAMLRSMLADRFKLTVRRETREGDVDELVVARDDRRLGERLHPTSADCAAKLDGGQPPVFALAGPDDPIPCGAILSGGNRLAASGRTMAQLAAWLAPRLQRIVLDKSGLTGLYDFDLQFEPDQRGGGAAGPNRMLPTRSDVPPLMTALQEQLGLKVQATRGAVDYVVIEGAERPAED